jgi:K+-transporting ATPase ATPase B chain
LEANDKKTKLIDAQLFREAVRDAFKKLNPKKLIRNPVMFVVGVGAVVTSFYFFKGLATNGPIAFVGQVALWLWFTVLFANFAEAVAEGRGRAQAETLRKTRVETRAKLMKDGGIEEVSASQLRKGDIVLVEAGDIIPGDAEVIEGIASVDESAITGESAPVIRGSGGDFSSVTGGTTILRTRARAFWTR